MSDQVPIETEFPDGKTHQTIGEVDESMNVHRPSTTPAVAETGPMKSIGQEDDESEDDNPYPI